MGKLACRIELDKQNGVTITVENEEGKINQTFGMNGETITIICAGNENSSTITQKADSIAIACKSFTLEAETIDCRSSGKTTHRSDKEFTASSGNKMSLSSGSDLVAESDATVTITGLEVKETARQGLSFSGLTTSISGKQEAKMSGARLLLSGDMQAELKAASVTAKATASMCVEGQITTIKSSVLALQGSLITLG